jgi:hypothetical protein
MAIPYLRCFDFDFRRSLWYKVPQFSVFPRGVARGISRND